MSRTWILQANPKLYDIDSALNARSVIYWRIPKFSEEVKPGDQALVWRAGKQAGFVGWGVFLSDPEHFDLSGDRDPFLKTDAWPQIGENYAPLRVWPAEGLPKAEVSAVLPRHQIVTCPMGTVFRLDSDDVTALLPALASHGYELGRAAAIDFTPLPILPDTQSKLKPPTPPGPAATITPALFLLSSSPDRPVEITIEGDALQLVLVERTAITSLDDAWDRVGVYLLIGDPQTDGAALSVYAGKAQSLRSRVKTGHDLKSWTRCLLVQRFAPHAFNASDISWLERRLIDVLLQAPEIDLINKTPPPPESVPDYKAEILERTVVAMLGVLGVLGAYVV